MGLRILELQQAWEERHEERGEEGTRTSEKISNDEYRQSLNMGKKRKSREESCKARMRKEVIFMALTSLPPPVSSLSFPHSSPFSPPSVPNPQPADGVRCPMTAFQWQKSTTSDYYENSKPKLHMTLPLGCVMTTREKNGSHWPDAETERKPLLEYYKTILKVNYGDQIEISTYVKHI